ncbi:hypothetical protein CCAX7_005780 [Capsulimonas corticalis]|uniref:non-reducing end alpha-L-arabinofuranosidase n=1 Tax=Capsulimonas corticalis TaxID=2219043 RepID=A0A402D351_9BACT|nr:alpha-L-arabinofuranosidase C-terminal domain-containing protein [Capsulimonas corticalis]BDI28527.1 hypothetical protein CCAX7_005780 [Capsulimonas corticalis]
MISKRFNISRSLAAAAVFISACGVAAPQARAAEAAAGYWPLDEGTGTTTADAGGQGATGTLMDGAGWATDAKVGKSALALGGHGSVDVANSVIDTSQSFTVSAWVKLKTVGGFQTFVSIDGDKISGFFLQLRSSGNFGFTHYEADNPDSRSAIAGALAQTEPNVWYHLIGVYDADAKQIKLYVNGVLQDTAPLDKSWRAQGHLEIGRGKYNGASVDFSDAEIDDVRVAQGVHVDPAVLASVKEDTPSLPATMTIDFTQNGPKVSPLMYGLMIEDISHSIDGGLYAELIRNRALKDDGNKPVYWDAYPSSSFASIAVDTRQPVPNTALTSSLRLDASSAGGGIANEGYWGIPVAPSTKYRASFYAKSDGKYSAPLTVSIQSNDGAATFATATVAGVTGDWKKYTVTLTTDKSAPKSQNNKFVIAAGASGALWFTQVSLFPPTFHDRPNGTRVDLMKHLDAIHPAFLRMPGGNYLEGNTIAERFDWKKTIGPIEQRPGHQDPWGYRSNDGFGLMEYLEWCDDLKMEPLLAVFAGFALGHEHVSTAAEVQPYVQDALDEIEYLIGGPDTQWGAERVKDGHPKPFSLHYVEIGNEDFFDNSGSYEVRYAAFHDAIKAKYPQLLLIATRSDVKSRKPDVIDDHYYQSARSFEADWRHYDKSDRTAPKVFVGEYASQEGVPTPNLKAALGDAAFMAGFERNADVVQIASYAPLLVNVNPGASQWGTNLIGFDALNSYVSPAYYTQQLFSLYHGDTVVPATVEHGGALSYVVSKVSKMGVVYVKVVNPMASPITTTITLNGAKSIATKGSAIVLTSANDTDTNTISEPKKVVPVTSPLKSVGKTFQYTFAGNSLTVLTLSVK